MNKISLILSIWLVSCLPLTNMPGTIKSQVDTEEFQALNKPYRGLNIILFIPQGYSDAEYTQVVDMMQTVSNNFFLQTGIYFKQVSVREIPHTPFLMETLYRDTKRWVERDWFTFDIAIVLVDGLVSADIPLVVFGMPWFGYTDRIHRRFIYLRYNSSWILTHELGHCFIFSHDHSTCLMASGLFLMPFCRYFTEDDWKEVQQNKFRDFGIRPNIPF